jgi:hypothetical protein
MDEDASGGGSEQRYSKGIFLDTQKNIWTKDSLKM